MSLAIFENCDTWPNIPPQKLGKWFSLSLLQGRILISSNWFVKRSLKVILFKEDEGEEDMLWLCGTTFILVVCPAQNKVWSGNKVYFCYMTF